MASIRISFLSYSHLNERMMTDCSSCRSRHSRSHRNECPVSHLAYLDTALLKARQANQLRQDASRQGLII